MGEDNKTKSGRKHATEGFQDCKEHLMAVLNCIPDPICVKDRQHKWVLVNDAFCEISGQTREAMIGKSDYDFFPKKEADIFQETDKEVFETGNENINEETITDSNGVTRTIITKKTLYRSPAGDDFIVAIGRDITERKRVEEQLRASESFLRQVIDAVPAHIFVKDREGKYLLLNKLLAENLGIATEALIGNKIFDLFDDSKMQLEEIDKFLADDYEIIETRQSKFIPEEPLTLPDGTKFWLQTTKIPLTLKGNPNCVLGISIDITARKNAEEALRQSEENFRQSQKMEAVGKLAGGIAHDFNNLLTAIIGYSEMLKMKGSLDTDSGYNVDEIIKAADRSANLTQQLLAFSRKQIMKPKILDLNKLIAETEKMLRRLIGEDIEIVTKLASGLGRVKADPGQIEQVIMNLAVNARDAMPEGGRLIVGTQNVYLDESYCEEHVGAEVGDYVMIAVSDTGHGIDEEAKERIFEPFFTTKEKGKGTGLGLSTAYGIVKQSGGYIWVYSEVNHGTTFKVYLPRVEKSGEESGDGVEKIEAGRGVETVLMVEDEEAVRKMICDVLRHFGYEVIESRSAKEAISEVKGRGGGEIDFLVTDVIMPEMGGRELAERLLKEDPGMHVLYISGYTDEAIVHHGVLDEEIHFLQKPFSPQTLAKRVRDILDLEKAPAQNRHGAGGENPLRSKA